MAKTLDLRAPSSSSHPYTHVRQALHDVIQRGDYIGLDEVVKKVVLVNIRLNDKYQPALTGEERNIKSLINNGHVSSSSVGSEWSKLHLKDMCDDNHAHSFAPNVSLGADIQREHEAKMEKQKKKPSRWKREAKEEKKKNSVLRKQIEEIQQQGQAKNKKKMQQKMQQKIRKLKAEVGQNRKAPAEAEERAPKRRKKNKAIREKKAGTKSRN